MRSHLRPRVVVAFLIAGTVGLHRSLQCQSPERINIYRFILDVDVPEPSALVALGLAPGHVLRASAPKPIAATVAFAHDSAGAATTSVALDVSPYFLLGGGIRSLPSYRSNSIAGRLLRVLTKTTLSLGAAWDPADPGAPRIALGLRSTFHDLHDPIPPTHLPEDVQQALAEHGSRPADDVEDVGDVGVDLRPLYRDARRQMRARRGLTVAGGWGFAGRLGGAVFSDDSLDNVKHTLWVTTQYTFGPRFDLLSTAQLWNGLGDDTHARLGAALQRKTTAVDLTAELYYDTADDRLHPGAWIEGRIVPRLRAGASLTSETSPAGGPSQLRVRTLIRWYVAQGE
jgi:hypothetical protein